MMPRTQRRSQREGGDADEEGDEKERAAFLRPRQRVPRAAGYRASRWPRWLNTPTLLLLLAACGGVALVTRMLFFAPSTVSFAALREPFYNKTMVQFTTVFGMFTVDLYPDHAPQSVENFMKLVEAEFYADRAGFYRNEPKFMLQGGAFLFDKASSFPNVPVEYSLPSEERMVVVARGSEPESGNSEFAIMLHDNSESNAPTLGNPGYTVFGRIVEGWHTIEMTSKRMKPGFIPKTERNRQVSFDQVTYVPRITNDDPEAKKRLEELTYALETKHTVVIFSEIDCVMTKKMTDLFGTMRASVRVDEIGFSKAHPYEREALEALSGTKTLPLVYLNGKLLGSYKEVMSLDDSQKLKPLLERSGALVEPLVISATKSNPVVIFSKSYCPYCKRAKAILASLNVKPIVFELDQRSDGTALQDFLFEYTGQATVPNVFISGKSIGGADNTQAMLESGQLADLLKRAGAIE